MKPEDRALLLKDISARLPYGVILRIADHNIKITINNTWVYFAASNESKEYIKPYLRPMSSMTEEEEKEYNILCNYNNNEQNAIILLNWLNKNHFDYYGLIPKGLAIEVTEENNPYK